jgi:type VI secretion system secreted protein VgrG
VRQPFRSPAGIDNNDVKRIVTKGGLRITFSDTPGEQGLTFVTPFGCSIKMLEKHPDTGFPMVAIETATGDIFLGAPEGRVHINSKFYSKEIG